MNTLDTTRIAESIGIRKLPVMVTWTMLQRFAEAVADEAAAKERAAIIADIPGGSIVDPQWICDMIRERSGANSTGNEAVFGNR